MDKIYIYDEIGDPGITAKWFSLKLNAVKTLEVGICFNSPGGDVFEGLAIYNTIKNYKRPTRAYIKGLTYGIASIIALGCDEIYMQKEAVLCLSEARISMYGDSVEFKKQVKVLEKINSVMAKICTARSKKTKIEILEMIKQVTWLSSEYAAEVGMVDFIYE